MDQLEAVLEYPEKIKELAQYFCRSIDPLNKGITKESFIAFVPFFTETCKLAEIQNPETLIKLNDLMNESDIVQALTSLLKIEYQMTQV